jgi:hypothetical protein
MSQVIIRYRCNGQLKSIPAEQVPEKHWPPRQEGINMAETPQNMQYVFNYMASSLEQECEEKYRPIREAKERKDREEVERMQKAEQERRLQYNRTLPQRQLEAFVSSTHFDSCNNPKCRTALRWHLICPNRNCEAPTRYNMESLIEKLREVAREYLKDKDKVQQ